ncbi:MAG: CPBP family intramembrane metalloprotease [Ignavibacteria bacterium]|nr:CPBP family intramembrane metalloprotease [Ignavibacteria bacterium]
MILFKILNCPHNLILEENNFNSGNNEVSGQKKGPLSNIPPLFFIFLSLSVVFFLYQIVGGLAAYYVLGADLQTMNENLNLTRIIMSVAQFMFILFPSIILVMLQDNDIKGTFRLRKPKLPVFILSVIGIFAIQPFLQLYLYYQNELIFSLPFGQEVLKELKELFDTLEAATGTLVSANSVPEFILVIIVIAVTPAIAEEFLFRGLVFRNFEKIIPAAKAVFFSGLIFALFHFHPFNVVPLAILGIFLTFIVYHSGSIYTAITCHFLNNFISAAAVFIYGKESFGTEKMTHEEQIEYALLGLMSFIIFSAVIILIKKYSVMKDSAGNGIAVSDGTINSGDSDE